MKAKEYVVTALMLAMGMILHSVMMGFLGMKFDLLLVFMVIAIALFPKVKNTLLAGIGGGILTALTTTFPGGELPNFIDKVITAFFVLMLLRLLSHLSNEKVQIAIVGFFSTMISGTIFLTSALLIAGLPAPFTVLFTGVVLPTSIINTVMVLVVYKACKTALKHNAMSA